MSTRPMGIVFDMGDVLYDATWWRRWLLRLVVRMGICTTYRAFFQVWDDDFLVYVHIGSREYGPALADFLQSQGLTRAQIDEVLAASAAKKRELESALRPFPGVRATTSVLAKRGIPMTVLSDSEFTGEELSRKLASIGLDRRFTAVISSRDIGHTKPHRGCYEAACAALGPACNHVFFVGHDAEELSGAHDAGMTTCAFNHDDQVVADIYLRRFEDLLELTAHTNSVLGAA